MSRRGNLAKHFTSINTKINYLYYLYSIILDLNIEFRALWLVEHERPVIFRLTRCCSCSKSFPMWFFEENQGLNVKNLDNQRKLRRWLFQKYMRVATQGAQDYFACSVQQEFYQNRREFQIYICLFSCFEKLCSICMRCFRSFNLSVKSFH